MTLTDIIEDLSKPGRDPREDMPKPILRSDVLKLEDLIDQKEDALQKAYLKDMKRKEAAPREGMLYSDLAASLERVGDHATNIAFSILNDDSEEINRLLEEEHVNPADYIL